MYKNATFVLVSTVGLKQPEWSPCTVEMHVISLEAQLIKEDLLTDALI